MQSPTPAPTNELIVVWRDNGTALITTRKYPDETQKDGLKVAWPAGISGYYLQTHVREAILHPSALKALERVPAPLAPAQAPKEGEGQEKAASREEGEPLPAVGEPSALDAIVKIDLALAEVGRINQEQWDGRDGWRVSIPARPAMDSDLIIATALQEARSLLAPMASKTHGGAIAEPSKDPIPKSSPPDLRESIAEYIEQTLIGAEYICRKDTLVWVDEILSLVTPEAPKPDTLGAQAALEVLIRYLDGKANKLEACNAIAPIRAALAVSRSPAPTLMKTCPICGGGWARQDCNNCAGKGAVEVKE
jgi:hypothetical protein